MKTNLGLLLCILIISCLSAGAQSAGAQATDNKAVEAVVMKIAANVSKISGEELKPLVGSKNVYIIDVRDKPDFDSGHIPGSASLPRAMTMSGRLLEHYVEKIVPDKEAKVVIYCEFTMRSPLVVKEMNDIGYKNAMYLASGFKSWKEAGYPVTK